MAPATTALPASVQPSATRMQLFGFGAPQLVYLTADPTTGAGVDAPLGSLGLGQFGGAGSLYLKTGAGVNDWTNK